MMKYWNPRRIARVRARKERESEREKRFTRERIDAARRYSKGDVRKNVRLMLGALGLPLRRKLVARLSKGGAMSVSKLADPFHLLPSSALRQVHILERAGLVRTKKEGRLRLCFLAPDAFKELSGWLTSQDVLRQLD